MNSIISKKGPWSGTCVVYAGNHGLWRCEKFTGLGYAERNKFLLDNRLCFRWLAKGHFKNKCPKVNFRCQVQGCNQDGHHTLLHPSTKEESQSKAVRSEGRSANTPVNWHGASRVENQEQGSSLENRTENEKASVSVATGAGEKRISLVVIAVKVKAKGGKEVKETYALLTSGSAIGLFKEQLR